MSQRVRRGRAPGKEAKNPRLFPTKPPTPRLSEKERTETSAAGGSKAIQKPVGSAGHVVVQEFAPSFALEDGRLLTVGDNVKAEPGLAVTMLQGLALPKDMEKVPQDLQSSLIHASAYLVQVCLRPNLIFVHSLFPSLTHFFVQAGKALLQASSKAMLAAAKKSRYRSDLKVEREKVKALKGSLKVAEARAE